MTTTHTPGPWYQLSSGIYKDVGDHRYLIAECGCWDTETLSNARLIAAAPDLLTVLQELQESAAYWSEYDVPLGIADRINAAVAKATGGAA